jgi:hypothetical protein
MNGLPQCIPVVRSAEVRQHVRAIQSAMAKDAETCFSSTELTNLRIIAGLTVEFYHYLQLRCEHELCIEYTCESVLSGIDAYSGLSHTYRILEGALKTTVDWRNVPLGSFDQQFLSTFEEFDTETTFERKCRLLLDLFRLQLMYVAISYI